MSLKSPVEREPNAEATFVDDDDDSVEKARQMDGATAWWRAKLVWLNHREGPG